MSIVHEDGPKLQIATFSMLSIIVEVLLYSYNA